MSQKSPDAYRTISEAGEEAGLPTHVLRFWEGKFAQLKPMKRAGGRRFYRPQDVMLLKGLKRLLYEEGYTIKGAQKYLREHGVAHVVGLAEDRNIASLETKAAEFRESNTATEDGISVDASPDTESAGERDLFGSLIGSKASGMSKNDKAKLKKVYDSLSSARDGLNTVLDS